MQHGGIRWAEGTPIPAEGTEAPQAGASPVQASPRATTGGIVAQGASGEPAKDTQLAAEAITGGHTNHKKGVQASGLLHEWVLTLQACFAVRQHAWYGLGHVVSMSTVISIAHRMVKSPGW